MQFKMATQGVIVIAFNIFTYYLIKKYLLDREKLQLIKYRMVIAILCKVFQNDCTT
ncbi:hypothetical protein NIES4103_08350 [Nostoc sp. NIES-4103]|nr:hypothetical protein NIES4103_08350 [Nostoc sp. NIES-4103]